MAARMEVKKINAEAEAEAEIFQLDLLEHRPERRSERRMFGRARALPLGCHGAGRSPSLVRRSCLTQPGHGDGADAYGVYGNPRCVIFDSQ